MTQTGYRPKIFIGSSSEGLKIARVAKELLAASTIPTLWEENIFLPGTLTLEVLEEQLVSHVFALLVATPDDFLVKRQEIVTTLRDNVLFECGLFMGALGRRRTFLFAPIGTHVELPTDLRGLAIAKYAWSEVTPFESLKPTITQIILAIESEWRRMQHAGREFAQRELLGAQHHALLALLAASDRLLDIVIELPRKVTSGLFERTKFDEAKRDALSKLRNTLELWRPDADLVNLQREFTSLVSQLEATLVAIPFYQDLVIVDQPEILVRDLPWLKRLFGRISPKLSPAARDFAMRLHLRDSDELRVLRGSLNREEQAVEQQVNYALRLIGTGLENWWKEHGPKVVGEVRAFQRQLIDVLQSMTYVYLKS